MVVSTDEWNQIGDAPELYQGSWYNFCTTMGPKSFNSRSDPARWALGAARMRMMPTRLRWQRRQNRKEEIPCAWER
eukprot:745926-Rhodomonas_salina.3